MELDRLEAHTAVKNLRQDAIDITARDRWKSH